uniref:uncharacterized protein LOC122583309 n=1 Tax=Erigeron canadensis TaxID=72917 RepID=UPI001CB8FC50|nr:uncharacterized protein LOC122583309 [Erigeron canadensis]
MKVDWACNILNNMALLSTHVLNLLTHKESLWVKWIHTYRLRGSNFWEISCKGNMSWSWRKLLSLRPIFPKKFWFEIGNGKIASAWYDNWNAYGALKTYVSPRMIFNAGFQLYDKVCFFIDNGMWRWPQAWNNLFPNIQALNLRLDVPNKLFRRTRMGLVSFPNTKACFILWLALKQKLKTQDMLSQWDVHALSLTPHVCSLCEVWSTVSNKAGLPMANGVWDDIISEMLPTAKRVSMQNVVAKLVFAASVYFIWQERNARLFKNHKRSACKVAEMIFSTVRLKLMTCRYKKTRRVEQFLTSWDLPFRLVNNE